MKHIIILWEGDREIILNYYEKFKGYTDDELVEAFYREKRVGIVGVRRQGLYLVALRKAMLDRFGESGITLEENVIGFED